jgi:hypothetical protein
MRWRGSHYRARACDEWTALWATGCRSPDGVWCSAMRRPDAVWRRRPSRPNAHIGEERFPCAGWEYTILILCKILICANVRLRAASFGMRPLRRSRLSVRLPPAQARGLGLFVAPPRHRAAVASAFKRGGRCCPKQGLAKPICGARLRQQGSRITFSKFCSCNNSCRDAFPHHVRLAAISKLFESGAGARTPAGGARRPPMRRPREGTRSSGRLVLLYHKSGL